MQPQSNSAELPRADAGTPARRRLLLPLAIGAALVLAVAGGVAAWLVKGDSGSSGGLHVSGQPAELVTANALRRVAAHNGRPIYWVGPRAGTRLEYTETTEGRTYVRYLTGNARVGTRSTRYVVIATYPVPDAYTRLRGYARARRLKLIAVPRGGIGLVRSETPRSVYVAFPNRPYQIEVYAPTAAQAHSLVAGGQLRPLA